MRRTSPPRTTRRLPSRAFMGALYVASDPRPVIGTHESNRLSRT
jgi:hypothetical protein